jgi:DNA-binding transcriptional LysR family regulator
LRLAELAAEPFISLKRGYGMRTLTETFCEQAGFVPQIKFEGDDVATIVGLVSSGLGVTLIPTFSGIDSAKIKRIPISEPLCQREIGLAWQRERILSPSVELFRNFVINQFR